MKIIRFEAENVKRLGLVQITPDGNIVELSGKNGAGKTSVLDAIWWALAGKEVVQKEPIKRGKSQAHVTLDLGDKNGVALRVIRIFKRDDDGGEVTSSLRVEDDTGAPVRKPQSILDALVGAVSFDPLEFGRSKPDERVAILKSMVPDFDFDAVAVKRQRTFDHRTEVNREAKRLAAAANAIEVPGNLPAKPIDVGALATEIANATEQANEINRLTIAKATAAESARLLLKHAEEDEQQAQMLIDGAAVNRAKAAAETEKAAAIVIPKPVDITATRQRLEVATETNAAITERERKKAMATDADMKEAEGIKLTEALDAIDKSVVDAVAAAELPVRGLTLGTEDVMLHGVPFDQASDAEQLRASIAIAMAANPDLRVIRVRDGSLIDADGFAVIEQVAAAEDFQMWIESVTPHTASAVIMEDGHVK